MSKSISFDAIIYYLIARASYSTMDIADKFLSWTSQDTGPFPYPLPYTSPTKESDFTLQLAYGLVGTTHDILNDGS
jgi:hypothetical protein